MCTYHHHNMKTFVIYGNFLNRLIIFVNFFCIGFTIAQDAYLTENGIKHYFQVDAANAMLTLFARNISMFIPESIYIYVFWPKPSYISEEMESKNSFVFKLNASYSNYPQQYRFKNMFEEDDLDDQQENHKNGYK